jgi:hypothetical protein
MPLAPHHTRRWFQFSLGTMIVVVTVAAGFVAYHATWIRQRQEFIAAEINRGAAREHIPQSIPGSDAPYLLRLLGATGFERIDVFVEGRKWSELSTPDLERIHQALRLFPEADIQVWNQESLEYLGQHSKDQEWPNIQPTAGS